MRTEALGHLAVERQRLTVLRQKQLDNFVAAAQNGNRRKLVQLFSKIRQSSDFLRTLGEIETALIPPPAGSEKPRYAVSSLFLYESFKKLTADRNEQFFFITGTELAGALVLDQWAEFEHQKRTVGGVTGDVRSTHKVLIRLEQFGHRLLAHFHSHPGNGPSSTQPSGIDENFQKRLEAAGHLAVMAIFSRDGFVRFVRLDGTPEIEIYGTGVEKHDHKKSIYRLADIYMA
ncbi:MAG TPA: hypothetical protein VHY84_08385 [Bryobacteraceae bacterium]|jgi:hypothetical protein|nr:hypothetical protein [Bryobacteraceae bacterium]